MKQTNIVDYLRTLGIDHASIDLVPYDILGEQTARKTRDPKSEMAKKHGLYFRPNYERGILIDALMSQGCQSYLEIGFGRGYSALCAAMAQNNRKLPIDVTVVDPYLDAEYLRKLSAAFPVVNSIKFYRIKSTEFWGQLDVEDPSHKWDMCYIDGDHSYEATKADWEGARNHTRKFVLFDDYHMKTKQDAGIECARAIDEITDHDTTLVFMDRMIFPRDDGRTPADVDYGQVIVELGKSVKL